jgi:carboxymethylenebutenolidase
MRSNPRMTDATPRTIDSRHDGLPIEALEVRARGESRGGIVVLQEIFGLTDHVAEMCAMFADAGYDTIAPSLFTRVERGFHAGHDALGLAKGLRAVAASPINQVVGDIQGAIDALPKPCFVTGFCYGGSMAWVAAGQCKGLSAASCFYGRLIVNFLDDAPRAPVMLHYGSQDASIPSKDVDAVRARYPNAPLHVYEAGHAFCRKGGAAYDAAACALAFQRTLDWFAAHAD